MVNKADVKRAILKRRDPGKQFHKDYHGASEDAAILLGVALVIVAIVIIVMLSGCGYLPHIVRKL